MSWVCAKHALLLVGRACTLRLLDDGFASLVAVPHMGRWEGLSWGYLIFPLREILLSLENGPRFHTIHLSISVVLVTSPEKTKDTLSYKIEFTGVSWW